VKWLDDLLFNFLVGMLVLLAVMILLGSG